MILCDITSRQQKCYTNDIREVWLALSDLGLGSVLMWSGGMGWLIFFALGGLLILFLIVCLGSCLIICWAPGRGHIPTSMLIPMIHSLLLCCCCCCCCPAA
ncbi:hypothetical protein BO71DRAFT_125068 [Aspergillus ellipticus CBS 707.79]|uniref:Uncharacterized protein n=1 Tax=Aspergillus ellipticus CBS 707.79 TaxID=1448320 RepID=A0A319DCW0_9EURO|nr:hypothetical protein BO71DRAFT_125068 [Aspergillus ellipticus CBS 707.79]